MKYTHIAFDVDGTLINTEYAILHSLQETMKTVSSKELPLDELTFVLGITGKDGLKRLGVEDVDAVLDLWNKKMLDYADTMTFFNGMTELLDELLKLDCKMGIITSRTREEFDWGFDGTDIERYFKAIVCADDTKEHKPTAEPLLKYMELSGADRAHVLYVGDSEYDSQCAQNAGVDFALAVWGSHSQEVKAQHYLNQPADLLELL